MSKAELEARAFTKTDSQVIKGAAILIMMWHHCFLSGRFEEFQIIFTPLTMGQVTNIALFAKICVSLFAFISGYGLFLSCKTEFADGVCASKSTKWLWVRYVRSFSGYWIIVVLSWIVCSILDYRPRMIYFKESVFSGIVYMVIDFLGLSKLFGVPSMIATWWYMSAAFIFIMLSPILFFVINRFGGICCFAIIVAIPRIVGGYPGGVSFYTFLPAFYFGMIAARIGLFSLVETKLYGKRRQFTGAIIFCGLSFLCYKISYHIPTDKLWEIKWGLFPIIYVLAVHLLVSKTKYLKKGMSFFGKHSANVFMIHTFIRSTYLRNFVYSRGHFLLIIATLFALSILCSILVEGMKTLINYNKFVKKIEAISIHPKNS